MPHLCPSKVDAKPATKTDLQLYHSQNMGRAPIEKGSLRTANDAERQANFDENLRRGLGERHAWIGK